MSDTITADEMDRVQALVTQVAAGDTSMLPELRQALDDNPVIWRQAGNLATQVELVWINLIYNKNPLGTETLCRFISAMKQDLVGPNPSPALRLLGEQVAISWLQLHQADLTLADLSQQPGVSVRLLDSATRRQQQFSRGHQRALALLETTRRLLPADLAPHGGGSPRAAEDPGQPDPETAVMPWPTIAPDQAEPARRIAAQNPPEHQAEPLRRVV